MYIVYFYIVFYIVYVRHRLYRYRFMIFGPC